MRKPQTGVAAATGAPAAGAMDTPTGLVCVALLLAIVGLACRVASLW
jgi:hypothetical protein